MKTLWCYNANIGEIFSYQVEMIIYDMSKEIAAIQNKLRRLEQAINEEKK